MENATPFEPADVDEMMRTVSTIFAELNLGLLIYCLETPGDPGSLKLVYANRVASAYTGADLSPRVGKYIGEAFPGLVASHLPEVFADVAAARRSRTIGAFEYSGDETVGRGYFSVKAFPMPKQCVGVVFENITARKQLEELVKKQRGKNSNRADPTP